MHANSHPGPGFNCRNQPLRNQQMPLDFTMQQNYPGFQGSHYGGMMQSAAYDQQTRMVHIFRQVGSSQNNSEQRVERPVAVYPKQPFAVNTTHQINGDFDEIPDFRYFSIREIATHFNVYISKAIIESAEAQIKNQTTNAKKLTKFLLRSIIGDEAIASQTVTGGRIYKSADPNILAAVDAIVVSRYGHLEPRVDVGNIFNRIGDYLREKRRVELRKLRAAAEQNGERIPVPKRHLDSDPAPASPPPAPVHHNGAMAHQMGTQFPQTPAQAYQHQPHWSQPAPSKRPYIQFPEAEPAQMLHPSNPPSIRYYSPAPHYPYYPTAASGVSAWPSQHPQQVHWNQYVTPAHGNNPQAYFPPSPFSLEAPTSVDSSNISPCSKAGSPDSVCLEICELEDGEAGAGDGAVSQAPDSQPYSQEFWDYKAQQDHFYET